MDTKFEIYIPTNNQKLVGEYATDITHEFGGCTIHPGSNGMWLDKDNYQIGDAITIIEVYALKESQPKIEAFAKDIAKALRQQCVSVTVTPAQMLFIYPSIERRNTMDKVKSVIAKSVIAFDLTDNINEMIEDGSIETEEDIENEVYVLFADLIQGYLDYDINVAIEKGD